jgi:hypothetical protein
LADHWVEAQQVHEDLGFVLKLGDGVGRFGFGLVWGRGSFLVDAVCRARVCAVGLRYAMENLVSVQS